MDDGAMANNKSHTMMFDSNYTLSQLANNQNDKSPTFQDDSEPIEPVNALNTINAF